MLGALIAAAATIVVALIRLVDDHLSRVERKIDGLRNGTYTQAMAALAEVQRAREERRLAGLPERRRADRIITPEGHD